ncbi:MAG TPA: type II toxin-antitoxin system Phd/YefM family antitoxin [Thermoflexia bacterium]|nr:type II toxin-antitoxin system Phd/YefM family antitoxin [Thermoflexia bacterium]
MSTKIMPISDLRRKASHVLAMLKQEGDAIYITHYGRPVAVMSDYEHYERLLARLAELTAQQQKSVTTSEPITDHTGQLAGLHREIWESVDTDAYLQEERDAWEN